MSRNKIRWWAACFAVGAGLAFSLSPEAEADDVQAYLDALHERGIYHDDGDGTMVAVGQGICDMIESGQPPILVARDVYRETPPDISAEDAGYIVGAAVAGLCPEYLYLIPGATT